jgi:GNAT superfamily N-acetyltransferase
MNSLAKLRAVVQAPLRLPSPLSRHRRVPDRHAVYGDLVLTAVSGPGPAVHTAAVLGPEPPERVLAHAARFFADAEYAVLIESDTAQPMEQALQARGWHLDEEEPALALSPLPRPLPTAAPPGLTIAPVTTAAQFAQYLALSENLWVPSLEAALDPQVGLLVGYLDAEPVAVARFTCFGEVAEILGVLTRPSHRRRGFGAALTWAAVAAAAQRGCSAVTLTASASGYPLYCRLGFVPVCSYRTYVPAAPTDRR